MTPTLRGTLIALLSFAVYSTHDVVVKTLGAHYAAPQIVFFIALFSFPVVSLLLMREGGGSLWPRHPWWVALRCCCTVTTAISCFYAFTVLPMAQVYAILFASPLLVTVLAIPFLGERAGPLRALAVAAGLVGVLILLRPGHAQFTLGHAAALVSAVSSSLGSVIIRKIGQDERPVVLMALPMLANVLVTGATLSLFYRPMPVGHLGLLAVAAMLSLGAGLLLIAAYRRAEAVLVAPMQYSQMIWAAAFGWLIFSEPVDRYTLAGAAVIMASGLVVVLSGRRRR